MSKVIVVIGASRGIGKELVLKFADTLTNTVVALSRDLVEMKKIFTAPNIKTGHLDLSDKDLHNTIDKVLRDIPSVDILINNAGKFIKKPFLDFTYEDIDACYKVNAVGTIFSTQYFVPKMLKNGGHIVNISTMGAVQGSVKFPELAAYSTSKASITSFTELFAEEFKDSKIKMNCLCLGAVQTEMFADAVPDLKAPLTASEMASFIVDFAYKGAQFFNGKIIPVSSTTP